MKLKDLFSSSSTCPCLLFFASLLLRLSSCSFSILLLRWFSATQKRNITSSFFIDQLREQLDREFPDTGPGPAVPPRPLSIQEILEDRLNGHTGFASPAPEPKDIELEWEGNVPPDLIDGFDFLL